MRTGFEHEAVFYEGDGAFLGSVAPFVEAGVEAGEPVLVAVSEPKIALLRGELGDLAAAVRFADIEKVGANPARILAIWREFVDSSVDGRGGRGVGEPVWSGRTDAGKVECAHHEALLNTEFDGGPAWSLLCPYDTASLDDSAIEGARRTHPMVASGGELSESPDYEPDLGERPFEGTLAEPPPDAISSRFDRDGISKVRRIVSEVTMRDGLGPVRAADLALGATEVATNSVQFGGGSGALLVWTADGWAHCEIRDAGRISDPMVGRVRPAPAQVGGRGLWLVNHLCDLVQIRSVPEGTVVRLSQRI